MASWSPGESGASRSWLQRLVGRIRYGLLTQELLNRIANAGIVVFPYHVVPMPSGTRQTAFTLQPDEAHLFDMHVSLRHRGLPLAGFLCLRRWSLPGCDLRIRRRQPQLPSAWVRRVPAIGKAPSDA
jgi:hypothetical protein